MITPRITRLVRVPALQAMHDALAEHIICVTPLAVRSIAIVVPTRAAAEALRRTLEGRVLTARRAAILPDLLTRDDLYGRLHATMPAAPPLLTEFEREVLFRRAARAAVANGIAPPFSLRPGLIVEILDFYDELRRRDRTVDDFARLATNTLAPSAEIDRGAARMLQQTHFLVAAFREFERGIRQSGRLDEHALRSRVLESGVPCPYRHIVLTIVDQAGDARGLWTADYDLLARIAGLETLDVVVTENLLASGFHQRIHDLLPGIEETRREYHSRVPVLVAPSADGAAVGAAPASAWFTCRDREEELVEVARRLTALESAGRMGAAFQRPLPYLYLARSVFADAGLDYQAVDALPLAAEPFAAALDVLFTFIITEATRSSIVELLASPHWQFLAESGGSVTLNDVTALDALLRERKYPGGWEHLASLQAEVREGRALPRRRPTSGDASRALAAAARAGDRLRHAVDAPTASRQLGIIQQFIRDHERVLLNEGPTRQRHLRARGALLGALDLLAAAHAEHDDSALPVPELAGTIRRWIEGQTFSPRTGTTGVTLLDAAAARFADLDDLRLIGLVESDWPERARRSIFYPASLLNQLGWPHDSERVAAARANFQDLLRLPRSAVSVSTFTLEDDGIVSPSFLLEEIETSGLPVERIPTSARTRPFVHERLWETRPVLDDLSEGPVLEWLALRGSRSPADAAVFRGFVGSHDAGAHAVSHVERYLDCPFKYFASHVLRVDEERDEESGLTPQERGQFLHEVFERFFCAWHEAGRQGLTIENLPDALALFQRIADARLMLLPEADRALERTYLLGSAAAAGLAERAFSFEIEHGVNVVERLLEYPLEGEFEFEADGAVRTLRIRAKADRIDVLEGGTLRIVDYKLGRAPKPARALQLPVYGVCAAQHLSRVRGGDWTVSQAGYVAFREKNAFVALGGSCSLSDALKAGQRRLLGAVDAIERGEFPPRPDEPFFCTRCGYAGVCRKDYVGDE